MIEVIDAHQHVTNPGDMATRPPKELAGATPDEWRQGERAMRLQIMENNGIQKSLVMPSNGYLHPDGIADTRRINDDIVSYQQLDPERFPIALGVIEPLHGERSLGEIDRIKELGLMGVVWHHRMQGVPIDNFWMRPYLQRMAELGLVPFIHTNPDSRLEAAWRLEKLARQLPQVTFVALDGLSSFGSITEYFQIAERAPNIVLDTAYAPRWDLVESFVKKFGSERVLFGSNTYSFTAPHRKIGMVQEILESGLSDRDKENVLGRNLRRIFGIN